MSKIAFIYPGQGAQAVGMGADFYEKSPLSKAVFDQASEVAFSQLVNSSLVKLFGNYTTFFFIRPVNYTEFC